jgi:hypothetical protein
MPYLEVVGESKDSEDKREVSTYILLREYLGVEKKGMTGSSGISRLKT